MESAIERAVALWFLLIGASHVTAPGAWADLFESWRKSGRAGGITNGLIHAPAAVLIVAFHQDYAWPAVVVTVIGWAMLLKAALCLLLPGAILGAQARIDRGGEWTYRAGGAFLIALGLVVAILSDRPS